MPLATYRSFLGVAKETAGVTSLTAAVAAGATTLTVSNTSVPASSTVFIWDGPLSESKNVSAGGGTTTLTVAALTNAHPAGVYVTSQLTASLGPTDYIPLTTIEPEDMYIPLDDKGYRGSVADVYNLVQGPAHSEFSIGGDVFADTIGYAVGGILGATDFTGGTPNTHAFSVKNTSDTQPTSFTLYDYDAATTRGYASSRFTNLSFKFNNEGLLTWTAKATGMASGIVATPTPSFSTVAPLAAWIGVVTIGGTVVTTLIDGDFNIARPVNAIQTLDSTQHPYKIWASAPVTVDGKLTFVMEDETELLRMINNTQPSLDILFSTGTGASQLAIQFHCTKAAYRTAKINRGQDYVQVDIGFNGLANTTDATAAGTGYSPTKVTIKNSKATGSYI
jgi:Phage tail tube protein